MSNPLLLSPTYSQFQGRLFLEYDWISHLIIAYLSTYSPVLLTLTLLGIVILSCGYFILQRNRLNFPIADLASYENNHLALVAATEKYPDMPFILPLPDQAVVILPITTLEEVRNLPENKASFMKLIQEIFAYKHTGIGEDSPEILKTIKIDLTRHIACTLDSLQEEICYGFKKELGKCSEWTSFNVYHKFSRIIALLSGRVFVGRPLSRDERWIETSINYTIDCENARKAIARYPAWTRHFVVPFLPEIKRVNKHKLDGGKLLEPILLACLAKDKNEKLYSDASGDEQGTFFSWILNHIDNRSKIAPDKLASYQMALSFAAIHTTTQTVWNVVCDLAARPQYIKPLREEIESIIAFDGYEKDNDGFSKLKKSSIPKLKKLDSFIKESQRLSPLGLVSMMRVTTAPLTLSTGHTIPTNTRFAFPSYSVHTSLSNSIFSPSPRDLPISPPHIFDGFRFASLRSHQGNEKKHQFVTTSPESLNFGHGNHACPGRFFASNEIKVVLIELLRSWDFRIKGDLEGVGGEEKRPKNWEMDMGVFIDVGAELEFRRRKV